MSRYVRRSEELESLGKNGKEVFLKDRYELIYLK